MARRHHAPVLTTAVLLGVGMTVLLSACSDGPAPAPNVSASQSATPTPTPTRTPSSAPDAGQPSAPSATPTDDQTGSADDGTGPGTGNGSGAEAPASVDWAAVSKQGIAAAGGGSVVSLAGSGDSWTVVVVGSDGTETQSVVSATLGRVTSGPFPKAVDGATGAADRARAAAATTDAAAAATAAERAGGGGKLSALTLGGSAGAPVWTATLTGGGVSTVTVDGRTGTATAG